LTLPLDNLGDISLEMHLLCSESSDAARRLMLRQPLDEATLEEWALMDDALAKAKGLLDSAVKRIKGSRKKRGKRAR